LLKLAENCAEAELSRMVPTPMTVFIERSKRR
jgi:hypothetical protein